MSAMPPRSHRKPGRLDVAASLVGRALPRPARRRLDQARLDARAVLDQLEGERQVPVRVGDRGPLPPTPLEAIDPVDHLLPRRLAERVQTLRRDVRTVSNSLRGRRPSPLVERKKNHRNSQPPPRAAAPVVELGRGAGVTPRPVTVTRVVRETADAVSLYVAEADGAPVRFVPGEFLTLELTVDGQRLRRAYSLAAPALPGHDPHITVKRVKDGRASNWLNDHAAEGDTLRVLGPSGAFVVQPDPDASRHLLLVAGGSGITPIASILHSVLETEPGSRVTLVYGNRRRDDIIFRERLAALAEAHGDRFTLDHVLSEPPEGWAGGVGLLDRPTLEGRLAALGLRPELDTDVYVCGPTPMMDAAREAFAALGVAPGRVHEEQFTSPELRTGADVEITEPQAVTIRQGGRERTVVAKPGQTVLEAGLAAGVSMPFSCAMGGCGRCRVKLTAGDVVSEEPSCITPQEKSQGYVLACVSRATRPTTVEIEE